MKRNIFHDFIERSAAIAIVCPRGKEKQHAATAPEAQHTHTRKTMAKTMDQHKRQIEELPTSGREDGMHEANVHRHRSRKKPRTAPMNGAPENLLDLSSPGRRPRNLPPRETAPLRALNDASHSSTLDAAATIPMSATASPTNEEDTRESLESREKLAIDLLCRMSLPQNKESWAPLDEPLDSPPHPPVTLCPRPQPLELAPTLHPTTEPMHDNQDGFQHGAIDSKTIVGSQTTTANTGEACCFHPLQHGSAETRTNQT
jgi:hypothetical protein